MSTLSQILAEKIANKNHEGLLKHPAHISIYVEINFASECIHEPVMRN